MFWMLAGSVIHSQIIFDPDHYLARILWSLLERSPVRWQSSAIFLLSANTKLGCHFCSIAYGQNLPNYWWNYQYPWKQKIELVKVVVDSGSLLPLQQPHKMVLSGGCSFNCSNATVPTPEVILELHGSQLYVEGGHQGAIYFEMFSCYFRGGTSRQK